MKIKTLYTVVDAHTEGNPERVVISNIPAIPGDTMLEKGIYLRKHMDNLRKVLTHEPRVLLSDAQSVRMTATGALFGPVLGVGFSLLAIQNAPAAIAAAIMSIMPVLIIPVNWLAFREKIKWFEVLGALVTVVGVILLYL